ncbi:MarR family transcriptional regulator [candidate division KSB1 bacterium]|nr:MarR family transcriptional regulator [candidate division KSB1 bacterium]
MTADEAICDQVVSALRGISRALELHYRQLLRDYGLSGPQIIVLKAVKTAGRRPISDVARRVHLSHATVTAIIDRLERKGLVVRSINADDRREVFISLTEEGERTIEHSPALLHEQFIKEFTGLDRWEQNQILASLQRVAKMIGAPEQPAPLLSIAPLGDESQAPSASTAGKPTPQQSHR